MSRAINPNLAKIHRNYTVEEVADLFGVHKNTVRAWIKKGLPVCDDRKPMLILGNVLREFLRIKKTANKQKCKPWEFYCVRCRKPQSPAGSVAEYRPETATNGRLIARCPVCDGVINKYSGLDCLSKLEGKLDLTFSRELKHINKRDKLLLNSDLNS
jgi:hypothetical protein